MRVSGVEDELGVSYDHNDWLPARTGTKTPYAAQLNSNCRVRR